MDRTARMLRRTLLCAVLVCPLAVWRMETAWIVQAIFALIPVKNEAPLWHKKEISFSARKIIALAPSLALQTALLRIADISALIAFTGILTQASLIFHVQKTGRRALAACLLSILVFIACRR